MPVHPAFAGRKSDAMVTSVEVAAAKDLTPAGSAGPTYVPCRNERGAAPLGIEDTVVVVVVVVLVEVEVDDPVESLLMEMPNELETNDEARSERRRQSESKAGVSVVNLDATKCDDELRVVVASALDTNTDVRQHANTRFEVQIFRLRRAPLSIKTRFVVQHQSDDDAQTTETQLQSGIEDSLAVSDPLRDKSGNH
jgi:hypothetical protein